MQIDIYYVLFDLLYETIERKKDDEIERNKKKETNNMSQS